MIFFALSCIVLAGSIEHPEIFPWWAFLPVVAAGAVAETLGRLAKPDPVD